MKKIKILLLFAILSFSCSSDEDLNNTPEFYNVKYEIIGDGQAYKIKYTSNEETVEKRDVSLPYIKEFKYKTEINGENNIYGIKSIIFWVYAVDSRSDIQEIRLYIDDELVDTDRTPPNSSNGLESPWAVSFDYLRRD